MLILDFAKFAHRNAKRARHWHPARPAYACRKTWRKREKLQGPKPLDRADGLWYYVGVTIGTRAREKRSEMTTETKTTESGQVGGNMAQVTMAQLIRYHAPQYLVEPVGDASDQTDLDTINASGWDELDTVTGWAPYTAVIRVWDDTGTASWTYLARIEEAK